MPTVNRRVYALTGFFLLMMALGVTPGGAQAVDEGKIVELAKPIVVDGSLDDWAGVPEIAVDRTPEGGTLAPSADLTVTVRLAFDAENLYAGVNVIDDDLVFPSRRLQEGDAFYITLVDPDAAGESGRYSTYGFSIFRGEEFKALISRNGKPELMSFVKDIQVKIRPAKDKKSVVYEVAVPWRYIPDFRPFLQPVWGINLAYVDYDAKTHKTVQLVPDVNFADDLAGFGAGFRGPMAGPGSFGGEAPGFERETTAPRPKAPAPEEASLMIARAKAKVVRKGRSFRFVPGEPAAPEFQSLLSGNHYFPADDKTVSLAINSPVAQSGWGLLMQLSSSEGSVQSKKSLAFGRGMTVLKFPIDITQPVWGVYDLSLGLLDEKGALKFSEDKQFFLIQTPEFEAVAAKVAEVKKGELYAKDEVFRESLPTLEVRLQWTEQFMKSADRFAGIEPLERWNEEIKELVRSIEAGRPALFPPGRAASLGYRSPVDGSLKSYAVYIPDWYDKNSKFPLFITLGGGTSDPERDVGFFAAVNYSPRGGRKAGDLIFMEPSTDLARNWYAGNAGSEIMAAVDHLRKLYSVNENAIVLDGFDRGAYGALRLALLNPGIFKGVVVRSGAYIPPEDIKAENLFDLMDRAGSLRILMIHGAEDELAPVSEARAVAGRLEKLGAGFRYVEVKDGRHTDYDRWSEIFGWLKDVLGDAVVTLKPPKKEKEVPDSEKLPAPRP